MKFPDYLRYRLSEPSPLASPHLNEAIHAIGSHDKKDRSRSVKQWELPE